MQKSLRCALVGAALLAAVVEGNVVAGDAMRVSQPPDCKNLYSKSWSGGKAKAKQGMTEYTWVFNPCNPAPASPNCNQPPYSGNVYIAQLNSHLPSNPCVHQLFCEASPESVRKNSSTGVVTYEFPQCVPSQTGTGPSPRSATINVHCDSPTFRVDPVDATRMGNGGWHFSMIVHGPCGEVKPPAPPAPACPSYLADVPTLFFTQPLNPKTTGDVYEWGVNLCNSTHPSPPMLIALDTKSGVETKLDIRTSVSTVEGGWVFRLSSSEGPDTGVINVQKAAGGGPCRYLAEPVNGVTPTVNHNLGVQLNMELTCM